MSDPAASDLTSRIRTVGEPARCPDDQFRRDVAVARGAFRDGLLDVVVLSPQETEDVLAKFDQSVMEIAASLIAHQVLARSVRAAAEQRAPLRLVSGGVN